TQYGDGRRANNNRAMYFNDITGKNTQMLIRLCVKICLLSFADPLVWLRWQMIFLRQRWIHLVWLLTWVSRTRLTTSCNRAYLR
ncbi:MAG: hypothetical protein ACKPKO_12615, partial [Candidatus Fonsibacter sp.]